MSFFDIFKIKKFKRQIKELTTERKNLTNTIEKYEAVINIEQREAITIKDLLEKLKNQKTKQEELINSLSKG